MLAHKPHYPDSVFHITLYDGKSHEYATELLNTLNRFPWNIRTKLPNNKIIEIPLTKKNSALTKKIKKYDEGTSELFYRITGMNLTQSTVESLSDQAKIKIIEKICKDLEINTANFEKALDNKSSSIVLQHAEPSLEDSASWSKYNSEENNKTGLYLTPPELATEITKKALELVKARNLEIHFGDPAIGTGVFFSVIQHLLPKEKIKSAIGIELNKSRAKITEERWGHKGLQVFVGDYLHIDNLPHRTLIIANPPYVRYQHIDSKYSKDLREKAILESGTNISGQSGLYLYFILASHAWMQDNAIAAWLIPSDFMSSNYGKALRDYLLNRVQIEILHIFKDDSPKFENAQVLPCVVIFSNIRPDPLGDVNFSYGDSLSQPEVIKSVPRSQLRARSRWAFGGIFEDEENFDGPALGELFDIKRGIATGANDYFILKEQDLIKHGIPKELTKAILPKIRYIESDIIEALPDGTPNISPRLFLLDTKMDEGEIKELYPKMGNYLDLAEERGVKERTLVKNRRIWTQQEQRLPAPFLTSYMGRGSTGFSPIRFLRNRSQAIATNNYLLLYPKPRLSDLLEKNPNLYEALFDLLKQVETKVLKHHWRKYGGGLKKIEPKDLKSVPLPTCPNWLEEITDFKLEL